MGIFTRLRDIIHSNLNAMLETAEDPEKLIKLMVQEMEDTLVEVKANCAGTMAARKRAERAAEESRGRAQEWETRAKLAVDKGREDLAREALREKRRFQDQADAFDKEAAECDGLVGQYKQDITALEDKLQAAREKHRILVQRHIHAQNQKRAQQTLRNASNNDAFVRFDQFENRIERMEADASLVNHGVKPSLEEQFAQLAGEEEIEKELAALKAKKGV
jgi:phage shock protein A